MSNAVILGLIILSFVAGLSFGLAFRDLLREQAIFRGYGLYCPTDGSFAWKDECND